MTISLLPQFFFISILSTLICITNFTRAYGHCLDDQKTLLLELKNDLIFDSSRSKKLVQWNQTKDCCSWKGVECDGEGHVISLQLDDEAISGGLENSSSIFSFRYLKKLNMARNDFNYIQIPRGIQNLTNLTHLNLSNAGFGGYVPIELSLLRRLISLDISYSDVGSHPLKLEDPSLKTLLHNLTRLRELHLDSVDISTHGSEWGQDISSSLPNLRSLSLCNCNLPGPLDPSLLQLRHLSVLQLDGNNLSTAVPDFFTNFSSLTTLSLSECSLKGSFPDIIFQVPTIENLDLSDNRLLSGFLPHFPYIRPFRTIVLSNTNFSGSLPYSISNLRMLSNIDVSFCRFTGSIPSALANLTELVHVDLSNNNLTGSLSFMHFEGFSNLVYLNLGYNSLSGSIPLSLFGLPSLETLILSNNQFSGQVNEFTTLNFSNMSWLDLSYNHLEGPIPESFFRLESLRILSLSYNNFNGTFQLKKIQRRRSLVSFDLSYNILSVDASSINSSLSGFPLMLSLASCNLQSFPDLRNQSVMISLDLSDNRIVGEIPSWIWEIGNGTLQYLNLSSNFLVELQKPYRISSSLRVLDLHSNQLQGELPLPPRASYLDFSNNNFDTPFPLDTRNFSSVLIFLSVANNSLTRAIPTSLCNAVGLQVLDLSFNNLSGTIPPCLFNGINNGGFSVDCGLKTLDLSNNNLRGDIPKSLGNCKSLEFINVGNNYIEDSFPCMLPSSLRVLVLRSNRFHGDVLCQKNWPNLQIIDIASNNFSGYLYPSIFSSLKAMVPDSDAQFVRSNLGFNLQGAGGFDQYEVTLTIKGFELKLVKIWTDYTSIDFSVNNFKGEIPNAIGDLSSLYLLNLSHNTLTGTIPESFGKLRKLGSLDVSVNQLTGMIPVELAGLTFLSILNLSYNQLIGAIPNGPQFRTFSAGFFEGNTGLCGFPLNISCTNTDESDLSPSKNENVQSLGKMEIEWDYVSGALGYVVGLGSIFWILLCCQSLRVKYFEKVDEVLEKIFNRQYRKKRHGRRALRRE